MHLAKKFVLTLIPQIAIYLVNKVSSYFFNAELTWYSCSRYLSKISGIIWKKNFLTAENITHQDLIVPFPFQALKAVGPRFILKKAPLAAKVIYVALASAQPLGKCLVNSANFSQISMNFSEVWICSMNSTIDLVFSFTLEASLLFGMPKGKSVESSKLLSAYLLNNVSPIVMGATYSTILSDMKEDILVAYQSFFVIKKELPPPSEAELTIAIIPVGEVEYSVVYHNSGDFHATSDNTTLLIPFCWEPQFNNSFGFMLNTLHLQKWGNSTYKIADTHFPTDTSQKLNCPKDCFWGDPCLCSPISYDNEVKISESSRPPIFIVGYSAEAMPKVFQKTNPILNGEKSEYTHGYIDMSEPTSDPPALIGKPIECVSM